MLSFTTQTDDSHAVLIKNNSNLSIKINIFIFKYIGKISRGLSN